MTRTAPIQRIALWLVAPSILLAGAAMLVAGAGLSIDQIDSVNVSSLIYFYVLLGSLTLNGWLRVRNPGVWARKALTPRGAVYTVLLFAFVLIAFALLAARVPIPVNAIIALGLVGAILSVASWVNAMGRDMWHEPLDARTHLTTRTRYIITASGLASWLVIVAAVITGFKAGWSAPIVLLILGLPWSHPAALVLAPFVSMVPWVAATFLVVLALCGTANVALALALVYRPAFRERVVRWFFRLDRVAAPARGIEAMSED